MRHSFGRSDRGQAMAITRDDVPLVLGRSRNVAQRRVCGQSSTARMSSMRVARLHGVGEVRIHDEPIPTPNASDSLVRITAVGICGSDLHWFSDAGISDAKLNRPLVLGHEFAGVVESTGQRVAVDPLIACGECEPCRESKPNLCAAQRFAGHGGEDGALREYIAWCNNC